VIRRCALVALLALAGLLSAAGTARAVDCLDQSVSEKLEGAQTAFIGHVTAVRPVAEDTGVRRFDYVFAVEHVVKGTVGLNATVRAAELVDIDNQKVVAGNKVAIGVLASRADGRLVTSTCGLVDPASLMGAADEPKGGLIKVAIGLVILGIVIWYSVRRLRRRQAGPARPPRDA
jgi:hypothetical protein